MRHKALFIGGEWFEGQGDDFYSFNPANAEPLWQGAEATPEDIDKAVAAARKAFTSWSDMSLMERKSYLQEFANLLEDNKEDYAKVLSQDTGKPFWESLTEVAAMVNKIKISFSAYAERCGLVEKEMNGATRFTRFKAHGVAVVLGPFNLPGHLPNGHIIPALLAGNTVVFKPSEQTPWAAQKYVELWERVKLPDGVLNMAQGKKEAGMALSRHPGIDALLFTGSATAGKAIHAQFAGQPEKVLALEMGGNNPLIVDEVKDLKAAAYATIQSAFITTGQRCTCARRLVVVENARCLDFLKELVAVTKKIRLGRYTDTPEPFMGPLISSRAAKAVLDAQGRYELDRADVLLRAEQPDQDSAFVSPGIIDVTDVERLDEEVFGPLLQVIRVKDLEAAIIEANNTVFGLSAGILTDNRDHYKIFFERARAGVISWNRATTGASSAAPFGGIGQSGNHNPSAYFAADYCAYPVASIEESTCSLPEKRTPGIEI